MVKLSESGKKALDDLAERIAKENKIPGFAFGATAVDDELVFKTGGYKVVNDPSGGEVDRDTVFWICSMTKLLAHISALQLIEQSKLSPDTPVSQFFPEFANPIIVHDTASPNPSYHPATTPILVKHLLNFSSGLAYNYNPQPDKPKNSTLPLPLVEEQDAGDRYGRFFRRIMGGLPGIPIKFEPGTDFVYGYSSDVLGFIVEKVAGKTLEQYLMDHVLGPLELRGSFYVTPESEERMLKLSFRRADGGLEPWTGQTTKLPERDPSKVSLHLGGVGYFTSLSDYLTLLRHILQIHSGRVTNGILSQATVHEMFVPASTDAGGRNLDLFVDSYGDPGNKWSTALAVCGADWPKRRRKGTAFWSGWAGTYYWMDPSTGIAAVFGTQIVPSRDAVVLGLYSEFEETLFHDRAGCPRMALLVVAAVLLFCLRVLAVESQALVQRRPALTDYGTHQRYGLPAIEDTAPDLAQDHSLLDIVLVSSVDGKFHALNRTSGHVLWSMSSFATTTSVSAPSSLSPLVRTTHPKYDPDLVDEDSEDGQHETYIIEPQSGDIYVLHSPSEPLQRFPFSMAELVDISPFTSVNGDDVKVFVGRKETSLLLIELETGKIKATLNAECPFIPDEYQDTPIDLDELEGSKPPVSAPTEVFIGRTDYIISIHQKPKPGRPAPPAQELSFSTYGPNNKDNHLQAIYRRTPDDVYIQPLATGEIVAFRTKGDNSKEADAGRPLWAQQFSAPVVAIFDVLQTQASPLQHPSHPFVLLQPRPRLQDLFPKLTGPGLPEPIIRNMGSAFVGMVDGTESLFVMSPERYPLIVFGGGERHSLPPGESHQDPEAKKTKSSSSSPSTHGPDLDHCLDNPYDPRCLVGVRALDHTDGLEGRMKRLLDGPKTPAAQQTLGSNSRQPPQPSVVVGMGRPSWNANAAEEGDNLSDPSLLRIDGPAGSSVRTNFFGFVGLGSVGGIGRGGEGEGIGGIWEAVIVSLIFGAFTSWMLWAKFKARFGRTSEKAREMKEVVVKSSVDGNTIEIADVEVKTPAEPAQASTEKEPPTPKAATSPLPSLADAPTPKPTVRKEAPQAIPIPATPATPGFDTPTPGFDTPTPGAGEDGDDLSDAEGVDGGAAAVPGKRRNRRGRRGKKKKPNGNGVEREDKEDGEGEPEKEEEKKPPSLVLTTSSPKPPVMQQPSLVVSDTVLGFGSHGTVVFQGSLQGRAVAVKRLLQDFVTLAAREVSILQDADDHPNVIRYYYQESHGNFLYIALELCPASLADIIENPDRDQWRDIAINFDPKKALKQITSGLRHLHALKLVHRDIKPQNILVSSAKTGAGGGFGGSSSGTRGAGYRMLISDFGLCKKLDVDQTSFLPTAHGAMGAGTVGWRAPEILGGKVKLDEPSPGDESSLSSRGSVATINGNASIGSAGSASSSSTPNRLTKSVDIFALGCLFYYTLTNGGHPYGDRFEREINIMKDTKDLSGLERFGEEGTEAKNLISAMLSFEAPQRPDTTTCLLHPFFWDPGRRLNFLQDASDRFEIMCRDPKDAHLLTLERDALSVVGNDWHARLDKIFIENLGKYRKYDGKSVQDLLRALRNKKHHYQDLPDNVKRHLGPMPEGFLGYFTRRYPQLFLHVHGVIKETGLYSESMFRSYFELPDS